MSSMSLAVVVCRSHIFAEFPYSYGLSTGTLFRGLANGDALFDIELQNVVEAIEGAAQRDAPCQLDNLGFGDMLAQPGEDFVAGLVPVVGDGDGILDHQPVDSVEFGMILVVEQVFGALFRNALDRQLRGMMRNAIGTLVEQRDRDQRQFEVAFRHRGFIGKIDQQRPDMLEDRRPVRHHAGLIFEGAIGRHLVPQRLELGGQIIPGLDRHARHRILHERNTRRKCGSVRRFRTSIAVPSTVTSSRMIAALRRSLTWWPPGRIERVGKNLDANEKEETPWHACAVSPKWAWASTFTARTPPRPPSAPSPMPSATPASASSACSARPPRTCSWT